MVDWLAWATGDTQSPEVFVELVAVVEVVEEIIVVGFAIKLSPVWHSRQSEATSLEAQVKHVEWQSPQMF